MSMKRLLSLLRRQLPEVPVSPADRGALEALLSGANPAAEGEVLSAALRGALEKVIILSGDAYLEAIPMPRAELIADLHLLAWAGFTWERAEVVGRSAALTEAQAGIAPGLEYIGFDYRDRVGIGPAPLMAAMDKVGIGEQEPWSVAAGITGGRLRVGRWQGGSEGWYRLALLAWTAGEELALPPNPSQ